MTYNYVLCLKRGLHVMGITIRCGTVISCGDNTKVVSLLIPLFMEVIIAGNHDESGGHIVIMLSPSLYKEDIQTYHKGY